MTSGWVRTVRGAVLAFALAMGLAGLSGVGPTTAQEETATEVGDEVGGAVQTAQDEVDDAVDTADDGGFDDWGLLGLLGLGGLAGLLRRPQPEVRTVEPTVTRTTIEPTGRTGVDRTVDVDVERRR